MKNNLNKFYNFVNKFTLIFTIISFSIALIGAVFFCVNRSYNYLNPLVLIVGSVTYLFFLVKLYKWIIKLDEKKKRIVVYVLLGLQFILLFVSTQLISSIPQVDLIHILTEINSLNHTGEILNNTYFSVYPNNRFLLLFLYGLQKILPISNNIIYFFTSSLCISIMSLFTYKTVSKVYDINKGILSLFICVLSPIFYLYVSYYYTDILMLPIASIIIYLIVKIKDEENLKPNIIYGILIGILSIIGYKIRAVAIFLLVAYFVYLIFTKKITIIIKKFIPIIISALITLLCIGVIEEKFFPNVDSNKEFPMTHWIMMGANKNNFGYYSQADYELSSSASTVKERQELNISEIKNRISNMSPYELVRQLVVKIVSVWGKGDYSYQKYLELVNDFNPSYKNLLEDRNIAINYLLQISKIIVLFMAIVSLINVYKSKNKSFMAIALFGAVLFYIIWEVCPRYGLSFLPWLILMGVPSYDLFKTELEKYQNKNTWKYVIVILTILIFAFGLNKYTGLSQKENMIAKDDVSKIKYISLNNNTVLTQSLDLYDSFNKIRLKFRFNEEEINSSYKLELLDESQKVVYNFNFTNNDLKNEQYTNFILDKTYNKGKYIIRLCSYIDSSLEVYSSYKEEFDYYPQGVLKLNEKEESGDLMFEIVNVKERRIYSHLEYLLFLALTLGVEYIVLFRKKEEVNEEM